MLADVTGKFPGNLITGVAADAWSWRVLHELYVPPRRVTHGPGVVIREAGPVVSVRRDVVPFLAGDLACFAADAQRGVGEESSRLRLEIVRFRYYLMVAHAAGLCRKN